MRRIVPAILADGLLCLFLVVGLVVGVSAAASRPFPDTRSKIVVFEDQLPSAMTEAQCRFAATHYAGSQKMSRTWTRRLRAINPHFLMLHYQLAVGAGPAPFMDGNQWISDFPQVARHEDWFLHDAHGHRLRQTAWNWDVMDIRFEPSGKPKTGFPAYWVRTALQRMRAGEDEGCFADSYTQDILMRQTQPSVALFTDPTVTQREWLPALNQFGAYCAHAFHAQPERFQYLPNLGGLMTIWDNTTDLLVGDGGMNEGFCTSGGSFYSDDDWRLQMSRVLLLASHGKIVLAQTSVDPQDQDRRWFVIGAYLLTKGRHSYLNVLGENTLEWYPEYALDLGAYMTEPKPDLSTYWNARWGLYRREYTKGMVLVNPSSSPVTVQDLGGAYRMVTAAGGGPVAADGKCPGELSTQAVPAVTIPAHSARILLKDGVP